MNYYHQLWKQLIPPYDETEAKAIIRWVLEVRYGFTLTDILCGKVNELSAEERCSLQKIIARLSLSEPVQYVLGETTFGGRRFDVAPGVLIPRTETEELCRWIVSENSKKQISKPCILDIGTGSGCIAITLGTDIANAQVTAWDISPDAIKMAQKNAKTLGVKADIRQVDALHAPRHRARWDIIVSNPPYICPSEAAEMHQNVLEYEPHTALFVPEEQPLLFYEAIAGYAISALKPGGCLYFEMNPLYSETLKEMLKNVGFIDIKIKKDTFGKDRMAGALRPSAAE